MAGPGGSGHLLFLRTVRRSGIKKKPLGSDVDPRGVLGGRTSISGTGTLPEFTTAATTRTILFGGGCLRSQRPRRRRKVWDRHPLTRGLTVLDAGAPMARAIAFRKTAVPKKPFSPHRNTTPGARFRGFSDGEYESSVDSCLHCRLGLRSRGSGRASDIGPGKGASA
jgi:hypothetical protein